MKYVTKNFILSFSILYSSVNSAIKSKHNSEVKLKLAKIGIFSLIPSYFITKIIDCFMEYKSEIEQYENKVKKEFF